MHLPAQILSKAVAEDATRPALTYYDDTPEAAGERIELSRAVLANWVAKAANALQEGLDVQPGSVVLVDLPAPHWRLAYWALAVWSVGATLTVDSHEGAHVLLTTEPDGPLAEDCDEVVAVALPALSRDFGRELRSGVRDEAAELATFADDFEAWDEVEADDIALVAAGERLSFAELLDGLPPVPDGARAVVCTQERGLFVRQVLHLLHGDGSAVLVRGPRPDPQDPRLAAEGVDAWCATGAEAAPPGEGSG